MTSSDSHTALTGSQLDQLRALLYEDMCKAGDEAYRLCEDWRRVVDEKGYGNHLERDAREAYYKAYGVSEGFSRALARLDSARRGAKLAVKR